MSRLAFIVALAFLAGCASSGWRAHRIDGRTDSTFERSVGQLQQSLPARRREELEVALAVIWLRSSAEDGDTDSNGTIDVKEIQALQRVAEDVLIDVRRGELVSALRVRGENLDNYVAQLDGLRYDDVVNLADTTSGRVFADAVQRREAIARCRDWRRTPSGFRSPVISRFCAQH